MYFSISLKGSHQRLYVSQATNQENTHSGITQISIFAPDFDAAVELMETRMLGNQPRKPAVAF